MDEQHFFDHEPFHGLFCDNELADWAICVAIAVACFVLVMIIPLPEAM